jgi:hypothetical protein
MKTTFAEILNGLAEKNATALVDKAYAANRLAKCCHGHAQRLLYEAKSRSLSQAATVAPGMFRPAWTNSRETFVLLRFREGASLHAPVRQLTPEVRAWLESIRRRTAV